MEHAPGPWESEADLPYNVQPRVHAADGSLICVCGNMAQSQDEWEANARLIAAAPDLYQAIIELIAHSETEIPIEVWEIARAAIQKAEGR